MTTYASYEKQIMSRVVTERHIVRIALNETKATILKTLSSVPDYATVSMVVGDDGNSDGWPQHGEIYFDYDRDE